MKIGEQIEALDKLIKQEKQRIVLYGETERSNKYTDLLKEKKRLQIDMSIYGDDCERDLSDSIASSRARSLDAGMSFTPKKTNALSFLKTLNQTAPSASPPAEENTSNRASSLSI